MRQGLSAGLCVVLLASCATDGKTTKQDIGTGAGIIIGGLAGSFFGKGSGRIVGAIAGAAIGGFLGNQIGGMLDEEDRKALQEQTKQALRTQPDNGQIVWTSAHSGATATVVPENTRVETREIRVVRDASVAVAPQIEPIGARYVAKSDSNVRQAPSADAAVTTIIAANSAIWVVGKVTGQPWLLVARNGKSIGYVNAPLLSPAPAPVSSPAPAPVPAPTVVATARTAVAAFDLDAAEPVRTPADLDALAPDERADVVVASVTCRDIKTVATARGETATATQTACRSPDGSWELN